MTVIERNNGLLQDVQTGSLQYIFLCNLVMNKIHIYQLVLFVSTLLLIGCKAMSCSFSSKGQFDEMKVFFIIALRKDFLNIYNKCMDF